MAKYWLYRVLRKLHIISRQHFVRLTYKYSDDYCLIANSNLFDSTWYLDQNPDVREAKEDPVEHYLARGWKEGRKPSRGFDGSLYLRVYEDVENAGLNPLVHYERHGRQEGRKIPVLSTEDKNIGGGGDNNRIIVIKKNGQQVVNPPTIVGLSLNISGANNSIIIYEPYKFNQATIHLVGDTEVIIEGGSNMGKLFQIRKTRNTKKNKLYIGKDFITGANCTIDITDAGDVRIGNDAKWSWNIYVKSDDTHPIFDMTTRKAINESHEIIIGDHVWIGMGVTILKNSIISNESVIGACSVVSGRFEESNVVIAGNPARIRKRNINWTHGSIESYVRRYQAQSDD